MNQPMTRREFLGKLAKWGAVGIGLVSGGHYLLSRSNASPANTVLSGLRETPKNFVSYSNKNLGFYFFVIQQEAINRAVESRGWGFQARISDMDPGIQFVQFEDLLMKKPLAIIIDPVNSEGFINSIEKAKKEGIPVGIVDNPLTSGNAAITVNFDNFKAGEMAAQHIVESLTAKYGEPRGTVLYCYGPLKASAFQLRKAGFEKIMAKYENIKLLSLPTEGDMTNTHNVGVYTLQQYPNLDAVHVASETPARGVYQALKEKNKLYPVGSDKHVIFVTIDGEPIAHEWIKEGWLDTSISQDPIAYGEICVELLEKYSLKGLEIPLVEYSNNKYYWEKANIIKGPSGPNLILPPFKLNHKNIKDKRHWANIAFHEWGIEYH